jgi:hypothetical protein
VVRRPHQPQALERHLVRRRLVGAHLLIELRGTSKHVGRYSAGELLIHRLLAAVADRAERVDTQHTVHPVTARRGDVQGEVAAPRMAHEVRRLPVEMVQHCNHVGYRGRDVIGTALDRGGNPALLERGDAVTRPKLVDETPEAVRHPRPTVQGQKARAVTGDRTDELAADGRRAELLHARQPSVSAASPARSGMLGS